MHLPPGFWTASRRAMVEIWMARGESRALMAAKFNCTPKQLSGAIHAYGLKARELLDVRHD